MPWTAIFDSATGRLLSVGDILGDIPAGAATLVLAGEPDLRTQVWDEASRSFISRPAKVLVDRIQELRDDPVLSAVWTRLTANQQTALRNRLVAFVGGMRFRSPSEPTNLGTRGG